MAWRRCAAVEGALGGEVRITGLVEKPSRPRMPRADLIVIGRYVLSPRVFEILHKTPPGRGNEIQLTDALQVLATMPDSEGEPVHGIVFEGRRYDTGDKQDFLRTQVQARRRAGRPRARLRAVAP